MSYQIPMTERTGDPRWIAVVLLFAAATIGIAGASELNTTQDERNMAIGYLGPTEDDRDIETFSLDYNTQISRVENLNLSIFFSLTATYATGDITQLEGDVNAGSLREVKFDNSAFGIGPGLLLRFKLIEGDRFSLHLGGSGSFIVYSERFPAGGEYYNFMWRGGPEIRYKLNNQKQFGFSYQKSHVSNGKGVSLVNPSYDAEGFGINFTTLF